MGVVDPTPSIRARYEAELSALRRELGDPKTFRERMGMRRKVWKLRKQYFGVFPRVARW